MEGNIRIHSTHLVYFNDLIRTPRKSTTSLLAGRESLIGLHTCSSPVGIEFWESSFPRCMPSVVSIHALTTPESKGRRTWKELIIIVYFWRANLWRFFRAGSFTLSCVTRIQFCCEFKFFFVSKYTLSVSF